MENRDLFDLEVEERPTHYCAACGEVLSPGQLRCSCGCQTAQEIQGWRDSQVAERVREIRAGTYKPQRNKPAFSREREIAVLQERRVADVEEVLEAIREVALTLLRSGDAPARAWPEAVRQVVGARILARQL